MTNIWADSYKEIRKPFFDTESLEEERAKRDYDDDGKIESGAKEHAGAVHNAIQRKRGGKPDGQDTSSVKEDVEQVEEGTMDIKHWEIPQKERDAARERALAKSKAAREKKKGIEEEAIGIILGEGIPLRGTTPDGKPWRVDPPSSRPRQSIKMEKTPKVKDRHNEKLRPSNSSKKERYEEVGYVNEAQVANRNPEEYERKQEKKYAPVRGEKRPMPPRGHKDREAFEKWYRANVREEAETLAEVDSCGSSMDKKVDVMKGGKKNKVTINPPIKEQVEEWVGQLVEEGYDLSEFTWDEMTKIYESALQEQMPATGDAETVDATDSAKLSAKRRMAQAQIRADLARVQYQKASMTKESVDSIVEYLSQRADAFENLEEGVFDPKKSKMRPASERTQRVMTDAQRKAAKKESERVAAIHSKGETVLAGMRPQKKGKVKTTPDAKPAAPTANRTVRGRYDKLAAAANKVLKSTQKDK